LRKYNRRFVLVAIALLSIFMAGIIVCSKSVFEVKADPGLPPMTLTVVGPTGTKIVLNQTNIGNLASYTGYGGERTNFPALKYPGYYTGVPLTTFVTMFGQFSSYNVTTIGSGNYKVTFTSAQLTGLNDNLKTYNSTLSQVPHSQHLTVMLAYYYNGSALSAYPKLVTHGPLTVAIVGPEGLYTTASLWNYNVSELVIAGVPVSVGGEWSPAPLHIPSSLNLLQLLAPWITSTCLVAVATGSIVYLKLRKKP
jgi:hypothetical protein